MDPQKEFKHGPSGLVLAPNAAGLPRSMIVDYDDKQLDVAAEFRSANDDEVTTVYVFRKVTGDVPLWFDRIQRTIEARDVYAKPNVAIAPAPFTPAGQSNARGLRVVYTPGGPPWKSSGAALTAVGQWYVAIRASSQTLTPDQMLTRIEQTFSAIKWPKETAANPQAYVVADCANHLAQGQDAAAVKDDGSLLLVAALAGNIGDSVRKAVKAIPPRWCRDPYTTTGAGVYRPDGAKDRYFVAFEDAGRGILVQPNGLAGILAGAKSDAPLTFMVELVGMDRRFGYGSFETLPNFAQATALIDHGKQVYSANTWGKDKNIEISADVIK